MGMIIPKEKPADKLFVVFLRGVFARIKSELILPFHCTYPSRILGPCPSAHGSFPGCGGVPLSPSSRARVSDFPTGVKELSIAVLTQRLTLAVCITAREKRDGRVGRERFPITGTFRSGIPFRTSLFSRRAPWTGL